MATTLILLIFTALQDMRHLNFSDPKQQTVNGRHSFVSALCSFLKRMCCECIEFPNLLNYNRLFLYLRRITLLQRFILAFSVSSVLKIILSQFEVKGSHE